MEIGGRKARGRPSVGGLAAVVSAILLLGFAGDASAAKLGKITYPGGDLPRDSIRSLDWGLSKPSAGGQATFGTIDYTKDVSGSTAGLFLNTAKGLTIPNAVLTFDDSPLEICLDDARVTDFAQHSQGSNVVESVSLTYQRILITADIGLAEIPVAGFDLQGSTEWNGPCP